MLKNIHEQWNTQDFLIMKEALRQASLSLENGELPVGCVISIDGQIIFSARNTRRSDMSKISHAEMNALSACSDILYKNRGNFDIYTTLEPCMMCMGAIVACRARRVIYGATDYMAGAISLLQYKKHYIEFCPEIKGGLLAAESLALLQTYTEQPKNNWGKQYFGLE